jgi:hypothetical protein
VETRAEKFRRVLQESGPSGEAVAQTSAPQSFGPGAAMLLVKYLEQFGYLQPQDDLISEEGLSQGLSLFREVNGLGQEGHSKVLEMIKSPRCGCDDFALLDLRELGPGAGVAAADAVGASRCRWSKTTLAVRVGSLPTNRFGALSDERIHREIERAFDVWTVEDLITFRFVVDEAEADIQVDWVSASRIRALVGDIVGVSEFPPGCRSSQSQTLPRRITLDDSEHQWSTVDSVTTLDIQSVLVHEIGHVLGFEHSGNQTAVMHSNLGFHHSLEAEDRDRLRAKYGTQPVALEIPTRSSLQP